MSTTTELRQMSISELQAEVTALLREQFNLRMQQGQGQEIRPHLIVKARKQVARIKTIITEKMKEGSGS